MGLGVLEPKSDQKVPGTVHLERDTQVLRDLTSNLKHGSGRDENIVLVPQPSDSPNDPLNWSYWKRAWISTLLSLGAGLISGTCQFLNPAQGAMAKIIHTTVLQLSRSASVMILCLGVAAIFTTPLARIYGKRPVLLASLILCIISYSIILAKPKSMTHIWVGRALWGVGSSPIEFLVSSSVGDLFFVHQRGFHLSFWHVCLSGGNSFGQVIASQIVAGQGYVWAYRYAVIFVSLYTILFFFLVPETAFRRAKKFDNDVHETLADEVPGQQANGEYESKVDASLPATSADKHEGVTKVSEERGEQERELRETYLQSLKVYHGRFSNENYLRSVLSPLAVLLLPGVAWAAYCYATAVALSIAISVSLSSIFSAAPYHFTTSQIGLTVLSAAIGDLIGNLVPGPISDWIVLSMSRRNKGVYEPEFRMLLVIPAFFIGLAGYWGFGLSIHYRTHWFGPVFCFGLSALAGQVVSLISNTYLLDCHRKYAQDAYAVVTLAKGILTFAAAFFISNWLAKSGIVQVFFLIGMFHGIACVWGLVLYVYGKRIRLAVHNSTFISNTIRFCGNKE